MASRTSTHGIHSVPLVNTQSLVLKSSVMAGRDESQSPPRTPAAAAGGAADGCCWRAGCCGHRRHGVVLRLEQLLGLVARVEQEAAARRRRGALRGLGTYVVRLLRQLLSGCGRALSARRPITGRRRAALVSGLENGQERRGRVGGVHNRRACCLAISVFLSHCVGQ